MSARERTLASKTLVCLLQGLVGIKSAVRIEFRDETAVTGKVTAVDGYMNVEMANVTYEAPSGSDKSFSKYCCQGKFIRYVHIPDEIDPIETIEDRLIVLAQAPQRGRGRGRGRGGRGGRGRGGGGGRGGRFSRGGGGGSSRYGGGSSSGYGGDRRSGYGGYGSSGGGSSYRSGGYSSGGSSRYDRPRY